MRLVLVGDHEEMPVPDQPPPRECLACYVRRRVDAEGCDGTRRWVRTWRSTRSPAATTLETRLARRGATCDCRLVRMVLAPSVVHWQLDRSGDTLREPTVAPECLGARARSTAPCPQWVDRAAIRW